MEIKKIKLREKIENVIKILKLHVKIRLNESDHSDIGASQDSF